MPVEVPCIITRTDPRPASRAGVHWSYLHHHVSNGHGIQFTQITRSCLQPLQWRYNGRDSFSNHQSHDCLLNRLSRRRSNKTSKLRVTGLCAGNSPGTGEFPAQMASNAQNVFIWWRHHERRMISITFILSVLMNDRKMKTHFHFFRYIHQVLIIIYLCQCIYRKSYYNTDNQDYTIINFPSSVVCGPAIG